MRPLRQAISDRLVGFMVGVAFMLVLIQLWGLSWVRFIAPSWGPGL